MSKTLERQRIQMGRLKTLARLNKNILDNLSSDDVSDETYNMLLDDFRDTILAYRACRRDREAR